MRRTLLIARPYVRSRPAKGKQRRISMGWTRRPYKVVTKDETGQGLAEYALILALIAIIAIVALIFLGNQISTIVSNVGQSL
jgi:pilus assembly protein Flp/PilA